VHAFGGIFPIHAAQRIYILPQPASFRKSCKTDSRAFTRGFENGPESNQIGSGFFDFFQSVTGSRHKQAWKGFKWSAGGKMNTIRASDASDIGALEKALTDAQIALPPRS